MLKPIPEDRFLEILADGVKRTVRYMLLLTDYHGGPTRTEYILTTDIARAFLRAQYDVQVEYLNRYLANSMVLRNDCTQFRELGLKRTDIAIVYDHIIPLAMIEVKIGMGGTLTPIRDDLVKLCSTIECMKATAAINVRAASVFQVHIPGKGMVKKEWLKGKVRKIEEKLETALSEFEKDWPNFTLRLAPLQRPEEGIVETEIQPEEDGSESLGEDGYATRYYAALIQSKRMPKKPTSFRERVQGN